MAQSRWNSSFEARHNELRYERARPESHMPLMSHVTHWTCASCVWGVTWGYVRAAVEQPSRREAREARARARDDRGAGTGGGGWSWRPRRHATRLEPRGALRRTTPSSIHRRTAAWDGHHASTNFSKIFERISDGHARGPALESRLTYTTDALAQPQSRSALVTPRAVRQLLSHGEGDHDGTLRGC